MIIRFISVIFKFELLSILKFTIRNEGKGKIRIFKNCGIDIARNSTIRVLSGYFQLNKKWTEADPFSSLFYLGQNSVLIVKNSFSIYSKSTIYVNDCASLTLGSGYINSGLNLSCFDKIEIGNDVIISDNVTIRDSDNHLIDKQLNHTKAIFIGNHVWIGMNVIILKGVSIGDGAIIGAGSVVNKNIPPRSLAVGNPAKVVKTNIEWK